MLNEDHQAWTTSPDGPRSRPCPDPAVAARGQRGASSRSPPDGVTWRSPDLDAKARLRVCPFDLAANALMVYALLLPTSASATWPRRLAAVAHLGERGQPVVLARGLDPVLGRGARRVHRGRHLGPPPRAPRAHAPRGRRLAGHRGVFSFLMAGPASPSHRGESPARRPGSQPLLQNHVLMAIHPPSSTRVTSDDIPFGWPAPRCWRPASARTSFARCAPGCCSPGSSDHRHRAGGWWATSAGLGRVLGLGPGPRNASFCLLTATARSIGAPDERKGALRDGPSRWCWPLSADHSRNVHDAIGVFNSVHSFTQSAIGPPSSSSWRDLLFSVLAPFPADRQPPGGGPPRASVSRDGAFLLNNLLFVLFTFTVLIGTVFSLVVRLCAASR